MKRTFAVSSAVLISALLIARGAGAQSTLGTVSPSPATERALLAAVASQGVTSPIFSKSADGALTLTGQLGGHLFAARFPANWNGEVMLFAHGYVTPGQPEFDPETDFLGSAYYSGVVSAPLGQGYAVAASAYDKTGYAVKSGIERTYRLKQFLDAVGAKRAYIAGASMGGDVTVGLIEQHPNDFVGALPFCGVVAGWAEEQRYLADFRVIYDFFTRNTAYKLPGAGAALTPNADFTQQAVQQSVGALFAAASKNLTGPEAGIVGAVSRFAGSQADPVSFITALAGNAYGLKDQLATAGGNGYSNVGKTYTYPGADAGVVAALNAGVERLIAVPAATAYLNANYTPTGKFTAKVLSFHNLVDPLVPYEFEGLYKGIVAKAGGGANLVQQVVDAKPVNYADLQNSGPAHCYFSPQELTTAWNELRNWVENGVKPQEGKNITDKPTPTN